MFAASLNLSIRWSATWLVRGLVTCSAMTCCGSGASARMDSHAGSRVLTDALLRRKNAMSATEIDIHLIHAPCMLDTVAERCLAAPLLRHA